MIDQSVRNSLGSTNKFLKNSRPLDDYLPFYFPQLREYNLIRLNIEFLKKQTYCEKFIFQIQQILWVFACLPIHEKISKQLNWESRVSKNSWLFLDYLKTILQKNPIHWITFVNFRFLFSTQTKPWLLKNFWIEKKFLLNFFLQSQAIMFKKEQIRLTSKQCISFRCLLKSFFLVFFFNNLKKIFYHRVIFIFNKDLLIVCCEDFSSNLLLEHFRTQMISTKIVKLQSLTHQSIQTGFGLYGWQFQKSKNKIIQRISSTNIRCHQLEIKRFLKNTGNFTIDQVICYLNQKIDVWQKIYLKTHYSQNIQKKLNNYLFWRIWYFLRKRHSQKGAKWISRMYYKKKTYRNWIFHTNNIHLMAYSLSKKDD